MSDCFDLHYPKARRATLNEQTIIVKHNVEMGHRLANQPDSKCYQLHGHSWWIEVAIAGPLDDTGMILDFAKAKKIVRSYLDEKFDHHFVVNKTDELAKTSFPGIVSVPFDPTVENMARHWGEFFSTCFVGLTVSVKLWEASTNAATWRWNVTTK
jgi:6-pyruvoyltetrahydropterin/6-carboxytetrahydropterin synthase